jgi:hypothetical protein
MAQHSMTHVLALGASTELVLAGCKVGPRHTYSPASITGIASGQMAERRRVGRCWMSQGLAQTAPVTCGQDSNTSVICTTLLQ